MVLDLETVTFSDQELRYLSYETPKYRCYFTGSGFISGKHSGMETIRCLVYSYEENGIFDFSHIYGAYRIILVDKINKSVLFFADNAGICCFYYDKKNGILSDSFLEIISLRRDLIPDYDAITDFIYFNCIYSDHTIVEGIWRTEAMKFYRYEKKELNNFDKNFFLESSDSPYSSLHLYMQDAVHAYENEKILDVITGGIDSRAILAHLAHLGVDYQLGISGNESMVDVKIARQISRQMNKPLMLTDEKFEEQEGWIQDLFRSTDGVTSLLGHHRLHKFYKAQKAQNFTIEFGGVCGELYKNSFLNQDFPFLTYGKVNYSKFFKLKVMVSNINLSAFSEEIRQSARTLEKRFNQFAFDKNKEDKNKFRIYFRAGIKILRARMVSLSNAKSFYCPSCSPLAEPVLYKIPYQMDPMKLQMGRYQRNEVSAYCELLSTVKTDRGTTCCNKPIAIFRESFTSYFFLFRVAFNRLFKRNVNNSSVLSEIYRKGIETTEFAHAIDRCKKIGVLVQDADVRELPFYVQDRLFTIGMVFNRE